MRIRAVSEAAPGRSVNEDAAFATAGLVGVLDGVSAPAGVDTGCVHGPAWYVRRLAGHLQRAAVDPTRPLQEGLADAIKAVAGDHDGHCDLAHPNTPAASVALVRVADHMLEYLVLCDAHVVLDAGDQVHIITDERFEAAVADIRESALAGAKIGTAEHDARVRESVMSRQQRTNQHGGYWIAAATPEAAYQAITGRHPLTGQARIRRAVLLTDGAFCAVEQFDLFDWPGLLDFVTEHGPQELIRAVRVAESADEDGMHKPRYKRHDDASVAVCDFPELSHV